MTIVLDAAPLSGRRPAPGGGLIVDARIGRSGVQHYRRPDGSTLRVYRSPETLRAADFSGAPITVQHPGTLVADATRSEVERGVVLGRTSLAQVGRWLYDTSRLLIKDPATASDIESRDLAECSCGYQADTVDRPGTTPDGEPYDAEFVNLRPNHVALLPLGQARAGIEARILDAADRPLEEIYIVEPVTDTAAATPAAPSPPVEDPRVAELTARLAAAESTLATFGERVQAAVQSEVAFRDSLRDLLPADYVVDSHAGALRTAILALDSQATLPEAADEAYLSTYLAAARRYAKPVPHDYNKDAKDPPAPPVDVAAAYRKISAQAFGGAK